MLNNKLLLKIAICVTELSAGWYKIAWAFLKLSSKNNELNVNKQVRLQLYKPEKLIENNLEHSDVFYWWQNQKLIKYPSSLYVTVTSYRPVKQDLENLLLRTSENLEENPNRQNFGEVARMLPEKIPKETTKLAGIECASYKLPNKCIAELDSFDEGALILKFSNSGFYLAAAVFINYVYTIVIYSVSVLYVST